MLATQGTYFYADFCAGFVKSFRYQNGQPTEKTEWPLLSPPGGSVTSFGEDADGELYVHDQRRRPVQGRSQLINGPGPDSRKRGLPLDFMNLYNWIAEHLTRGAQTDNARQPLPKMRDAEDETRSALRGG